RRRRRPAMRPATARATTTMSTRPSARPSTKAPRAEIGTMSRFPENGVAQPLTPSMAHYRPSLRERIQPLEYGAGGGDNELGDQVESPGREEAHARALQQERKGERPHKGGDGHGRRQGVARVEGALGPRAGRVGALLDVGEELGVGVALLELE